MNHTSHLPEKVLRTLVPESVIKAPVPARATHREMLEATMKHGIQSAQKDPWNHAIPIVSSSSYSWSSYPTLYSLPLRKGHLLIRSWGARSVGGAAVAFIANDGLATLINPDVHWFARDLLFAIMAGGHRQTVMRDQTHSPIFPVRWYDKSGRDGRGRYRPVAPGTKFYARGDGIMEMIDGPKDYYVATDRKISYRAGKAFKRIDQLVQAKQLMYRQVDWRARIEQLDALCPEVLEKSQIYSVIENTSSIPDWKFHQLGLNTTSWKLRYLEDLKTFKDGQHFKPLKNLAGTHIVQRIIEDENDNVLPLLASFSASPHGYFNWRPLMLACKGAFYLKER